MLTINALHADFAVASGVAYSSTNIVKVSIITRIDPLSGNGPMKSMLRHSMGLYVESYCEEVCMYKKSLGFSPQTSFDNRDRF